jgi:hypothetical protein
MSSLPNAVFSPNSHTFPQAQFGANIAAMASKPITPTRFSKAPTAPKQIAAEPANERVNGALGALR